MPDINIGAITEALNDKSDRDLRNVDTTAKADAVIDYQEPTSANNYTWYRKYKSGWVVQGGPQSTINTTINLPVEMANTDYVVDCGIHIANYGEQTLTKQTTFFSTGSLVTNVGTTGGWTVKGMAA